MTTQIYSITEIRDILNPIFKKYDVRKAVLFGSYGKSQATEKSDVDILVDSGLRGFKFLGLSEDIRAALDKELDIFDVTHINPKSPIDEEINNTGVLIYGE